MKTIRSKLIAALIPIIILGMIGLGAHSIYLISQFNQISLEQRVQNLVTIIDDRFESEVRRNTIDLRVIPQSEIISSFLTTDPNDLRRSFHKTRALRLLHTWVRDTPGFLQLSVLDKTGIELLKVGEGIDPFVRVDEENVMFLSDWQTKQPNQTQYAELTYSRTLKQYVYKQGVSFQTFNSIQDAHTPSFETYRIVLTYSVEKFSDIFLKIQTHASTYLLLIDNQRRLVAGHRPVEWQDNVPSGERVQINHEWYVVCERPLANGLLLQLFISEKDLKRDAQVLKQITLFWTLITIMACLIMMFFVLRRFVLRPLNHLQTQIDRISQSKTFESNTFKVLETNDEIGQLHQQFASMLDHINASRQKAERAIFIDPLTDIPNRAALHRVLTNLTENDHSQSESFVLIQMKLHDISRINQTFGDRVGDRVLCFVAQSIQDAIKALRRWDSSGVMFFARTGGDEFSVVLPAKPSTESETKNSAPEQFCHYMASHFDLPHAFGAYQIKISFSAGIAQYPEIAQDAEQLIECASHVRRKAYRMRGCHWYAMDQAQVQEVVRQKAIETALRQAIQRNELYLEFQPQYEISTRIVYSAEALLRWVSHDVGKIGPDVFIPIAERSGLILEIDLWVLEQACAALQRIHNAGIKYFSMAINASSAELANIDYPNHVSRMLTKYHIDPELVTIEVTETAIVTVDEIAKHVVTELRLLGVEIALDDFGTGFTSLTHLSTLHLDKLKIDRSYVDQLESNPKLLDSIINLGHAFDMKIVAEGVEFESQLALLKARNCHFAQGFLLSRPIAESALLILLQDQVQPDLLGQSRMPSI